MSDRQMSNVGTNAIVTTRVTPEVIGVRLSDVSAGQPRGWLRVPKPCDLNSRC